MRSVTVEKLEERWTPTTVQTAFAFHSPSSYKPKSGGISIDLPLLNLGWTFTLSLNPEQPPKKVKSLKECKWIPAAFSFRQHSSAIPWGNTSIHAQLSLGEEGTPHGNIMDSILMVLGTMNVNLARTPSLELPITTRYLAISLLRRNKVSLDVTISDCPLANGLFQARSGPVNEAEVQAQLVRQSGDRLLSRSLATGKVFDMKFLTLSTSGNTGRLLPTYASLSVLEEHVNLSSCEKGVFFKQRLADSSEAILREGWTNALSHSDSPGTKNVGEISCPDDHEYELDSDFEDEDEASSPPCERDLATLEGQPSESGTESSLSSFVLDEASDQRSIDYQHQEVIKGPKEPSSDSERTVLVKFAAHKTWHAFLWYCYTGNLQFGKLKSQVESGVQYLRVTPLEVGPPTCSPKSMYRLADLVGDKDLKAKALAAIKERMTEANVLDETFSVYTSKYPDVREVQLGILMEHSGSPKVKEAFLRAMEKYSSMPHAKPVLSAFYDNLVA